MGVGLCASNRTSSNLLRFNRLTKVRPRHLKPILLSSSTLKIAPSDSRMRDGSYGQSRECDAQLTTSLCSGVSLPVLTFSATARRPISKSTLTKSGSARCQAGSRLFATVTMSRCFVVACASSGAPARSAATIENGNRNDRESSPGFVTSVSRENVRRFSGIVDHLVT